VEKVVFHLSRKFREGAGPLKLEEICEELELSAISVEPALEYLEKKGWLARVLPEKSSGGVKYLISREFSEDELSELIRDHLQLERISRFFDVESLVGRLGAPRSP
jgi:predicted transcriptional regulator